MVWKSGRRGCFFTLVSLCPSCSALPLFGSAARLSWECVAQLCTYKSGFHPPAAEEGQHSPRLTSILGAEK